MDYLEHVSQPSAVQLARLGDYRAIAYWLNACLVPQGIYARVASARPGVLLILLEFIRLPHRDRLNKIVCHRLCRLNSPVIRGVRILTRFANSSDILWDTSVRLVPPARRRRAAPSPQRQRSRRQLPPHPVQAHPHRLANLQRIQTLLNGDMNLHGKPKGFHANSYSKSTTPQIQALVATPTEGAPLIRATPGPRRSPPALAAATTPVPLLPTRRSAASSRRRPRRVTPRPPALRLTPRFLKRLGTSAAAIFLLGWGIEMWHQLDASMVLSDWMNGKTSIRTASGRVPIIEGGQDSDNSIVTLTFAGGSALTSGPADAATGTQTANGVPAAQGTSTSEARTAPAIPAAERPLPAADVTLASLNHSLTSSDPSTLNPLPLSQNASVNMVSVSGKSVSEGGTDGLVQTLDTLQQSGLHPLGAGRNRQEARLPEIVNVRGKRIAYLGYSDADDFAAGRWRPGNNPAFKEQMTEDIAAIRNQVDWVIVNYHWSQDLASYPADWQVQMAHSAIDQGADLVVGYHPEVLQGAEIYKGRVIAYSLGNFIFSDQPQRERSRYDSAVLKVSLKDDRMRLEFIPVEVEGDRPLIAQGQKAKDILTYLEQSSALFEHPMKSPTILDRLALDPNQPAPAADFNPDAEPKPAASPSDSFITYPAEGAPAETTPDRKATPPAPDADTEVMPDTMPSDPDRSDLDGSGLDRSGLDRSTNKVQDAQTELQTEDTAPIAGSSNLSPAPSPFTTPADTIENPSSDPSNGLEEVKTDTQNLSDFTQPPDEAPQ